MLFSAKPTQKRFWQPAVIKSALLSARRVVLSASYGLKSESAFFYRIFCKRLIFVDICKRLESFIRYNSFYSLCSVFLFSISAESVTKSDVWKQRNVKICFFIESLFMRFDEIHAFFKNYVILITFFMIIMWLLHDQWSVRNLKATAKCRHSDWNEAGRFKSASKYCEFLLHPHSEI